MLVEVEGCTRFEEAPEREAFGFEVVDQRDYTVLAWRGDEESCHEIAAWINREHAAKPVPPSSDVLIAEIVEWRITGAVARA